MRSINQDEKQSIARRRWGVVVEAAEKSTLSHISGYEPIPVCFEILVTSYYPTLIANAYSWLALSSIAPWSIFFRHSLKLFNLSVSLYLTSDFCLLFSIVSYTYILVCLRTSSSVFHLFKLFTQKEEEILELRSQCWSLSGMYLNHQVRVVSEEAK